MKPRRAGRFYTKMLGRKVRLLAPEAGEPFAGRIGEVVNVYLGENNVPTYTVMLKDGRLVERTGGGLVVEK